MYTRNVISGSRVPLVPLQVLANEFADQEHVALEQALTEKQERVVARAVTLGSLQDINSRLEKLRKGVIRISSLLRLTSLTHVILPISAF
jgi:hypothetical protein